MKKTTLSIATIFMLALIPMTSFAESMQGQYQQYFGAGYAVDPVEIGAIDLRNWKSDQAIVIGKAPGNDIAANYETYFGQTVLPAKREVQPVNPDDWSIASVRKGLITNDIPTHFKVFFNL